MIWPISSTVRTRPIPWTMLALARPDDVAAALVDVVVRVRADDVVERELVLGQQVGIDADLELLAPGRPRR